MAYLEGFEPPTVRSVAGSSIQLSHRYIGLYYDYSPLRWYCQSNLQKKYADLDLWRIGAGEGGARRGVARIKAR